MPLRKPWIEMEQATIALPLEGLAWLPDMDIPRSVKRYPMVGTTLRIIKNIFKTISPDPNPMISNLITPNFQPGLTDPCFNALLRRGCSRLIHFSMDSRVMTKRDIESNFLAYLDFLHQIQLVCIFDLN